MTADPSPAGRSSRRRAIRDLVRAAVLSALRRDRVHRRRPGRAAPRAVRPRAPGPRISRSANGSRSTSSSPSRTASRSPRSPARSSRAVRYTLLPRARPRARPGHDPDRPAPAASTAIAARRRVHRGSGDRASVGPRRERDGRRLMPRRSCDGAGFLAAFRSAVANLEANVDEINALNVFPVPDGDTGSNMLATVRAALEEADKAGPDADADRVAHAVSFGALMGARGNSGRHHEPDPRRHRARACRASAGSTASTSPTRSTRARRRPTRRSRSRSRARSSRSSARPRPPRSPPRSATTTSRRCSPPTVDARRARGREDARRCCRSCARRTSWTRAARACSACSRARSRRRAAGRCDAAAATTPGAARRDRRRGATTLAPGADEATTATRRSTSPAPATARRSTSPAIQRHLEAIGDSVLVAGDDAHGQDPRPQRAARRGDRLRALARVAEPDQRREPRRPGARRARGRGERIHRRGRRGLARRRRRPSPGGHAHGPATPMGRDRRDAPAARRRRRRPVGRAGGAARRARRRVQGVRRRSIVRGGQSANPWTGELLAAVEATPRRRAADPAQQPERRPRRAPGRDDDRRARSTSSPRATARRASRR